MFITGAGSGLGLAFATEFARDGWRLGITDVNQDTLSAAAATLRQAGGEPTEYIFDVASYEDFRDAVMDFEQKTGGIDIGINNAGIGCGGYLHEVPIEAFRRVIDINLMGVVHGCQLFTTIMRRQHSGHILNVASAAAFAAAPQMTAYNTSKAAVLALSETLRSELHDEGVLVSVLMPTYVRTNIGRDAIGTDEARRRAQLLVEESRITPEEAVAETVRRMEAGDLYVVLPAQARFLWRFKRFLPDQYWRFVQKEVKRRLIIMNPKED